jgi:WXXGXW repeat (2 copies)
MMKTKIFAVLLGCAGWLFFAGCVYRERVVYPTPTVSGPARGEVIVSDAPPAPRVERITVAPGPAFVWVDGFWAWRGHWVWRRGYWARPPHHGAVWVGPRYVVRGGRHYYSRGYWR